MSMKEQMQKHEREDKVFKLEAALGMAMGAIVNLLEDKPDTKLTAFMVSMVMKMVDDTGDSADNVKMATQASIMKMRELVGKDK